ncbi:hypothetical protein K438DRAFT_2013844 [Mycena galopus ATCC 62051]|nr:hypothetical protein K438DRAFT_2013844 [Mycena galopus ATCC 62051]
MQQRLQEHVIAARVIVVILIVFLILFCILFLFLLRLLLGFAFVVVDGLRKDYCSSFGSDSWLSAPKRHINQSSTCMCNKSAAARFAADHFDERMEVGARVRAKESVS